MRVGVLAIQGDVREHRRILQQLGVDAPEVRTPADLEGVDGLVIPGGESTTIGLLMDEAGLVSVLRTRITGGFPVYGTCAGLILLARDVEGPEPRRIGLMDITAARNAFGRQIASFEARVPIPVLGAEPFPAVFIRAPRVTRVGPGVRPLAYWQGEVVMAEEGSMLVSSFHPELTADLRVHEYFLRKVTAYVERETMQAKG
ncbi:MAG: pyridoxal 5'-phosphate synthase glutaminase subunit PdxT [Actinomycetia bacterium]|nr:pyridoxal 5'-phosphate synthase glutaminase subunit PdxT [Actinomycetes bacterium]